jgi:hypothetical protein
MDVERIIDEIEQLQEMFEAPDIRPLSASDTLGAFARIVPNKDPRNGVLDAELVVIAGPSLSGKPRNLQDRTSVSWRVARRRLN